MQTKLARHTFNAMSGVDVLDKGDLVTGSATLAGDDCGVRKEVLPDL